MGIFALLAYAAVAGSVYRWRMRKHAPDANSRRYELATESAFLAGVAWPLAIPFFIGDAVTARILPQRTPEAKVLTLKEFRHRLLKQKGDL